MQIHQLSAADAIASLNSNPQGLSSTEAMRRLGEYGLNRVEEVARESTLLRFLKEFTHFFALILWLAAGLAFVAEWSDPGHGMAKVGYAILAVILVSGLFLHHSKRSIFQSHARRDLRRRTTSCWRRRRFSASSPARLVNRDRIASHSRISNATIDRFISTRSPDRHPRRFSGGTTEAIPGCGSAW